MLAVNRSTSARATDISTIFDRRELTAKPGTPDRVRLSFKLKGSRNQANRRQPFSVNVSISVYIKERRYLENALGRLSSVSDYLTDAGWGLSSALSHRPTPTPTDAIARLTCARF